MSEHSYLNSYDEIKAEIYNRGPIACSIFATKFLEEEYTKGIYVEKMDELRHNHAISIVGWGVSKDGVEYWYVELGW